MSNKWYDVPFSAALALVFPFAFPFVFMVKGQAAAWAANLVLIGAPYSLCLSIWHLKLTWDQPQSTTVWLLGNELFYGTLFWIALGIARGRKN